MEKECLDLLLRGDQPIVICPARSIENMRIPKAWRTGIDEGRLLILSPFGVKHKRPTTQLTEQRNRFVAELANKIVIGHATENGKIASLCSEWIDSKQPVYTLDVSDNMPLIQQGAIGKAVNDLVQALK
jgi:predicted Rossmann fold nucleotide-binding protein DprA/Smf involved in DNA uptake